MRSRTVTIAAISLGVALALPVSSHAVSYSAEYVFGDSLSDQGNLAETGVLQQRAGLPASTNFPFPPSYHDSFTNGPVAVQVLANVLGLNADPSLWVTGFRDVNGLFGGASYPPGTNYAVAGATSAFAAQGGPQAINLPQQVGAYLGAASGTADPNALYIVMIGGNDVRNAALAGTGSAAVAAGVTTEVGAVQALTAAGARNVLVANVPNVGIIPEFRQDNPSLAAAATTYSQQYDQLLATNLASLALSPDTNLYEFDLYAFNQGIVANAAALGFTNTSDRCFTSTPLSAAATPQCGPNGQDVNSFTYWDSIHPTAPVQALWGRGLFETLEGTPVPPNSVPEPASLAMLGAGLLCAIGMRRRG